MELPLIILNYEDVIFLYPYWKSVNMGGRERKIKRVHRKKKTVLHLLCILSSCSDIFYRYTINTVVKRWYDVNITVYRSFDPASLDAASLDVCEKLNLHGQCSCFNLLTLMPKMKARWHQAHALLMHPVLQACQRHCYLKQPDHWPKQKITITGWPQWMGEKRLYMEICLAFHQQHCLCE